MYRLRTLGKHQVLPIIKQAQIAASAQLRAVRQKAGVGSLLGIRAQHGAPGERGGRLALQGVASELSHSTTSLNLLSPYSAA